jgi:hypothetical protein
MDTAKARDDSVGPAVGDPAARLEIGSSVDQVMGAVRRGRCRFRTVGCAVQVRRRTPRGRNGSNTAYGPGLIGGGLALGGPDDLGHPVFLESVASRAWEGPVSRNVGSRSGPSTYERPGVVG